jgi:hypothetical protein
MFVSQSIFDTEIAKPMVCRVNGYLCSFDWPGNGEGMISVTVPSMVVILGRSEIRFVTSFDSAILADLVMRGFAISFWTLAAVASADAFLRLLLAMHLSSP